MKQTSIEWLIDQLKSNYDINIERLSVTDKAKALEKKQIMEAHNKGYADGYRDNGNRPIDYFTETFKK